MDGRVFRSANVRIYISIERTRFYYNHLFYLNRNAQSEITNFKCVLLKTPETYFFGLKQSQINIDLLILRSVIPQVFFFVIK